MTNATSVGTTGLKFAPSQSGALTNEMVFVLSDLSWLTLSEQGFEPTIVGASDATESSQITE
jgi:hypothetical protein